MLPCNSSKIHGGAVMWVLSHHVKCSLANALDSCMCVETRADPLAASVQNKQQKAPIILRWYPELVNHLLVKYATDQAIAKFDAAFLQYMQLVSMTLQQYADDIVEKLCKVVEVRNDALMKNVLSKRVDQSIRHSLQIYRETNPKMELTDIALQTESLLPIQKASEKQSAVNGQSTASSRPYCENLLDKRSTTNSISGDTLGFSTRSPRRRSNSLWVVHVKHLVWRWLNPCCALSFFLPIPTVQPNSCNIYYEPSYFTSRMTLLTDPRFLHLATTRSTKKQKPTANFWLRNTNKLPNTRND